MKITSKIKDYSVELVEGSLSKREELFSDLKFSKACFFVDRHFYSLYKKQIDAFIKGDPCIVIEATEPNKAYIKLADYYQALLDHGFQKKDLLVTFGGGILQDISGFIASTLYRGIPWVYFPTTLLAQADSCIGSKTSINFGESKNLIGTFYPPDRIFIDMGFAETLTDEYFNSGVGEIIKFHLLSDPVKFQLLKKFLASENLRTSKYLKKIILSTLEIKKSYFDADEFDTGRRNLLNYGHSFGHALESASNFGVCHGEAVIVGMGLANLVSLKRGLMAPKLYEDIEKILYAHYPRFDLSRISADQMLYYLMKDKKRAGQDLTLILARDIGDHQKFDDVKEREIKEAYSEFLKRYPIANKSSSKAVKGLAASR